jgi:hypothetical protein
MPVVAIILVTLKWGRRIEDHVLPEDLQLSQQSLSILKSPPVIGAGWGRYGSCRPDLQALPLLSNQPHKKIFSNHGARV